MGYKSQNIRYPAGGLRVSDAVSEAVSKAERRFEIWPFLHKLVRYFCHLPPLFSAFHHPGPVSDLQIESRFLLR